MNENSEKVNGFQPVSDFSSVENATGNPSEKPTPLPVFTQGIPEPLKAVNHWVLWKYELREGKWTKPLKQPSGYNADVKDMTTWTDFETAHSAYYDGLQSGRFDGIGFVLTRNLNITGFDFDKCLDDSGNITDPKVSEFLKTLNSYTEVSPSGKGLRVFAYGELPKGGSRSGGYECYMSGRYLTLTGHRLPEYPADIELRGAEIATVHQMIFDKPGTPESSEKSKKSKSILPDEAKKLLNKAFRSKNGKKIKALYQEGNWKDQGFPSQSEADESLCCSLAFWFGRDPKAIDAAFRESALFRAEKWDKVHHSDGSTYGKETVRKAVELCKETYEERRSKSLENAKYSTENGVLCHIKDIDGKDTPIHLCNFDARITEEIEKDNSVDRTIIYRISGKTQSGVILPEIDVYASQFDSMKFVSQWGVQANIYAGQGKKDHLRSAIQTLSIADDIPKRTIYTHLGWRNIDGKWAYLSCNGAIGADGLHSDIEVIPDSESFRSYALPAPEGDLISAVRASLRFLDIADRSISVPLLSCAYRAAMNELSETDDAVYIAGVSGSRKTSVSLMIQSHFGDFRSAPEGWSSTENALEKSLFEAKDAVLLVDDFVPTGSSQDVQKLQAKAERVIRGMANHSSRKRLNAESSSKRSYQPRCLLLITGEDLPRGQSLRGRLVIIEIEKDTVNLEVLTECQEYARQGLLALSMAGFVKWLASQDFDQMKQLIHDRQTVLRNHLLEPLADQHTRTPDKVAKLFVGFEAFLDYAVSVGAMTAQEKEVHRGEAWDSLLSVGKKQSEHQESEDPAIRFFSILRSALSSGSAHIADTDYGKPEHNADSLGWRGDSPRGKCVGWTDRDGIYLDRDTAFEVVQGIANTQGEGIRVTQTTLWKRMKGAGFLARAEKGKNTIGKTVSGVVKDVLCIRQDVLKITGAIGAIGVNDMFGYEESDSYITPIPKNEKNEIEVIGAETKVSDSPLPLSDISFAPIHRTDNLKQGQEKYLENNSLGGNSPITPIAPVKNSHIGNGKKICLSCRAFAEKDTGGKIINLCIANTMFDGRSGGSVKIPNPEKHNCNRWKSLSN